MPLVESAWGAVSGLLAARGWDVDPLRRQVTEMLDWLIRHDHARAAHTVATIVGEAETALGMPVDLTGRSLRKALSLDGRLDAATYTDFFDRALPPQQRGAVIGPAGLGCSEKWSWPDLSRRWGQNYLPESPGSAGVA